MNQKDYNQLSEKTLSYNFYVDEQRDKNLLHAVMGLVTESVELVDNYDGTKEYDSINVFEEFGDQAWYLAIIQREFKFDYDFHNMQLPSYENKLKASFALLKKSNALLDYHKKLIFYGKPLDHNKYLSMSLDFASSFYYLIKEEGFVLEEILETNIAKLKARYGEKFNSDGALNRDLEKERQILKL